MIKDMSTLFSFCLSPIPKEEKKIILKNKVKVNPNLYVFVDVFF